MRTTARVVAACHVAARTALVVDHAVAAFVVGALVAIVVLCVDNNMVCVFVVIAQSCSSVLFNIKMIRCIVVFVLICC